MHITNSRIRGIFSIYFPQGFPEFLIERYASESYMYRVKIFHTPLVYPNYSVPRNALRTIVYRQFAQFFYIAAKSCDPVCCRFRNGVHQNRIARMKNKWALQSLFRCKHGIPPATAQPFIRIYGYKF